MGERIPLKFTITNSMVRVGLNSIYFETIEKQYKYYKNLACHGTACLLCGSGRWEGGEGRSKVDG